MPEPIIDLREDITKLNDLFGELRTLSMSDEDLSKLGWGNAFRVIEFKARQWSSEVYQYYK